MVCIQSENLHGVSCHAKMRLESVEAHRWDDCLIVVLNTFRFLQQNKKKLISNVYQKLTSKLVQTVQR